jgi:hypothetical protein
MRGPQPFPRLRPIAAVLSAGVLALAGCARKPAPAGLAEFQRGVAYTGYSSTSYDGPGPRLSLDRIKQDRASWISLLVTGYQESIDTTAIGFSGPATPADPSLEQIIGYAHGLGLKVMLKPHVDLANDGAHYRGEIGPDFTPADWAAWFASYRPFILHYAEMAARTGCELFCVGCELGTTAVHAAEWRSIVEAVRKIYPGPLTYADNQVEVNADAVSWWDAVDFIGQDCYPTLTQVVDPSVDDLLAGWVSFRAKLEGLSARWDRPLILTEIGCRSVAGGAQNPWDWQRPGAVDLAVQRNFYEAAFRALDGLDWVRGVYWWQWSPDPGDGGQDDTGYSPRGKPAEDVLGFWFPKLR